MGWLLAWGERGSLRQLAEVREACWAGWCPGLESRGAAALWLGAWDTGSRLQGCRPGRAAGSESNMASARAGMAVVGGGGPGAVLGRAAVTLETG